MLDHLCIEEHGSIYDIDDVTNSISDATGRYTTADELDTAMRKMKSAAIEYYPRKITDLTTQCKTELEAGLKLVETPYHDSKGNILYFSFVRPKGSDSTWVGAFVGTKISMVKKYFKRVTGLRYTETVISAKSSENNEELEKIYNILYYKENWRNSDDAANPYQMLSNYMKGILQRILALKTKGVTDYFRWNLDQTKLLVNTSLVDKFGNYVHIIYNYEKNKNIYSNPQYVESVFKLQSSRFSEMRLNLMPVKFYDKPNDLIFDADLADFDLNNPATLNHIINERKSRMGMTADDLDVINTSFMIRNSIDVAIRFSRIDYRYAIPMYSIQDDRLKFLLPVYAKFGVDSKPMFALVVEKTGNIWIMKTILTLQQAYQDARLVSAVNSNWLDIKF
ncbi:MAG: DUF3825 domain-containing protein [Clostridiales bacterium]|nr:DUF3825 domain-containing protein [Clostridiales bacterium]